MRVGGKHPFPRAIAPVFWTPQDDDGNDAVLTWEERPRVAPGDAATAHLEWVHPELLGDRLRPGIPVFLREGRRIVARGLILTV
jgi:hypothetical protein